MVYVRLICADEFHSPHFRHNDDSIEYISSGQWANIW